MITWIRAEAQLSDTDNDKLKVISKLLCVQHHYMNLETLSMADVAVMIETRPGSHLGLCSRLDLAPKRLESPLSHHFMTRLDLKFSWLKSATCTMTIIVYSVSQKSSPPKLFAVFSLLVNLCNWKLSWLLPKHIPIYPPILVHLSENLCEMYHFYQCDPSNFKNSI